MSQEFCRLEASLKDYAQMTARRRIDLSKLQTKSWLKYAAAASAGLAASAAGQAGLAAIVHSGPINERLNRDDEFFIDVNGDGIDDFLARNYTQIGFTYYYVNYSNYWLADIRGDNGEIAINPIGSFGYVDRFASGAVIDGNNTFGAFPTIRGYRLSQTTFGGSFGDYFGSFSGQGFAGVRFDIGGQNHFGWIQLDVDGFDKEYRVIDWAYETVPNTAIEAGATTSGPTNPDGDYNNDGTVNAADYSVWLQNLGSNAPLPNDPVGGTIGPDQYSVWKDNFGASAEAAANHSVPEPGTVTLGTLALGAAGIAALRRKGKRAGDND